VTERLCNNLGNMAAHGINLVSVGLQGTNGGWPDVNAGRNGYTPEGHLKPEFARRLEWIVREADKRGMVSRIRNELGDARAEFMGVIVNGVRSSAGGYMKGNIRAAAEYAKA
jgi:hypothetical protein